MKNHPLKELIWVVSWIVAWILLFDASVSSFLDDHVTGAVSGWESYRWYSCDSFGRSIWGGADWHKAQIPCRGRHLGILLRKITAQKKMRKDVTVIITASHRCFNGRSGLRPGSASFHMVRLDGWWCQRLCPTFMQPTQAQAGLNRDGHGQIGIREHGRSPWWRTWKERAWKITLQTKIHWRVLKGRWM